MSTLDYTITRVFRVETCIAEQETYKGTLFGFIPVTLEKSHRPTAEVVVDIMSNEVVEDTRSPRIRYIRTPFRDSLKGEYSADKCPADLEAIMDSIGGIFPRKDLNYKSDVDFYDFTLLGVFPTMWDDEHKTGEVKIDGYKNK